MSTNQRDEPALRKPLRLWPGVFVAVALAVVRFVLPTLVPETLLVGVIGGLVGALLILVWWLSLSRAPWFERIGALVLMTVTLLATRRILHESVANGMMGMMFFVYAIPALSLAFVAWAHATRRLSDGIRRASMVGTILLACGAWALVRTGGITGDADSDFHWRWTPTPEERLLAQVRDEPAHAAPAPVPAKPGAEQLGARTEDKGTPHPTTVGPGAATDRRRSDRPPAPAPVEREPASTRTAAVAARKGSDWPGFRGPARNDVIRGVRIETDWSRARPVELWRQPIGPGWSSFAVDGDFLYTQEQRGDDEIVSCYRLSDGQPVWRHRDAARFWESNAGPGPRATPTVSDGRVYTLGATGILNALDARTGAVVWSRNAASDTGAPLPGWGFAGSPLVVDDLLVVATAGRLGAYDIGTGRLRWTLQSGGSGYSSPQLATIDGIRQVLLLNTAGVIGVAPADGALLWKHEWNGDGIVQPAVIGRGDVLIGTGSGLAEVGMRRLTVSRGSGGWAVTERWTSNRLKPYFNDFVVHGDHAYGFDGSILACIELQEGTRKWKGGRYGHGQLVLLPEQDLLLVLSEEGELALVSATPDRFAELARVPAVQGKTWNHPVLVGELLLVRNGEEMAAFRLSVAGR